MKIQVGLTDYQVIQRTSKCETDVECAGSCESLSGEVRASVLNDSGSYIGTEWRTVGKAEDGLWSASGLTLPVGGEYTIKFQIVDGENRILEQTVVNKILVGDLWILAGQSNMEGVGLLSKSEEPSSKVHSFDMADRWCLAKSPLHKLWESVDTVHSSNSLRDRSRGVCPGLSFAKELVVRTNVPVGLIPCAHGGTAMGQWSPEFKHLGGESLYGSMLRRFRAIGAKVTGILWYQGESDAMGEVESGVFGERFLEFVQDVRKEFGDEKLPFYYVQIGRVITDSLNAKYWNRVQEAQRLCVNKLPYSRFVPSIDLPMEDLIHISSEGQKRLGQRLAKLVCMDLFKHSIAPGPTLDGVYLDSKDKMNIRVLFCGVNGSLRSLGRPAGFSIVDSEGQELPIIYRVDIDPYEPISVLLRLTTPLPEGSYVMYGLGLDPYCNMTDAEDMAVPVFGPVSCMTVSC